MGKWLRINGEAIYATQPWLYQTENGTDVWYTAKQASSSDVVTVYGIVLEWPTDDKLVLPSVKATATTTVSMIGYQANPLKWTFNSNSTGITVDFSTIRFPDLPSTIAWVIRLDGLDRSQQQINPIVKENY